MPRGDKSKYTDKQQRKAEHIEESYEKRGVSEKEAEARAWATVNKQSGGGERKGGSGGRARAKRPRVPIARTRPIAPPMRARAVTQQGLDPQLQLVQHKPCRHDPRPADGKGP